MKYIYTAEGCGRCENLKKKYKEQGIEYVERDVSRLKNPIIEYDDIDVDAQAQLAMQSMLLPIEVDRE